MTAILAVLVILAFACVIWVLFAAAADKIRREQAMREWWEHPPDREDEEDANDADG